MRRDEKRSKSLTPGCTQRNMAVEPLQSSSFCPRTALNLSGGSVQEVPETSIERAEVEILSAPDNAHGTPRLCGVCGDVAKSLHFGGLSCHSCKAFFRRSVQNNLYSHYVCTRGRCNCPMTKASRKTCQFCRMKKCFAIGMEKRWVMTEDERKAFVKARSEKKSSRMSEASTSTSSSEDTVASAENYVPLVERISEFLSPEETKEIETIVLKYLEAYKQLPYRSELHSGDVNRPGFQVMELLGTVVKRFAFYARTMRDFAGLPSQDQKILLKEGVLEMCLLRGALAFDPVNHRWPNTDMSIYKNAPVLNLNDVTRMVSSDVIEKHIEFIQFVQKLGVDEAIVMLLTLIVLFTSRPGISCPSVVENRQMHYTTLLKHYAEWRFGLEQSRKLFNKLLTKLSDLRELSESHNQRSLHFERDEVATIRDQLKDLKISPFPAFNILGEGNGSEREAPRQLNTLSAGSQYEELPRASTSSFEASSTSSSRGQINPAQVELLKGKQRVTDSGSLLTEELKGQMKQPQQNPQSFITTDFMNAIHRSVDEMTSQSSDCSLSELFNFLSSPPSLNAEDYEASFELSGQPFQSESSSSESTSNETTAEGAYAELMNYPKRK